MRIPVPTSFRAQHVAFFAVGLFLAQQILGTTLIFSALSLAYLLLFATAYNLAGGIFYPSGAYIFFSGTLGALVGLIYKCIIGEPAQTNLKSPNLTMLVYCGGMASMAACVYVSRRFRRKKALLTDVLPMQNMRRTALACLIIGMVLQFAGVLLPPAIYTAVQQINRFPDLAMILSFYAEIRFSGGRRSFHWVGAVAFAQVLAAGLIGFSKLAIFEPIFIWIIVCVLLGYSFSRKQLVGILLGIWFMFAYLVPYAQVGRAYRGTPDEAVQTALAQLSDLGGIKRQYDQETQRNVEGGNLDANFYSTPQGFFDRLQMIGVDDALITYTEEHATAGLIPTYYSYLNLLPHFLYPDKPSVGFGNLYARQMGMIPEHDDSTGISFGPVADAYHQVKWYGVFVLLPVVLFILFALTDALTGDVRSSPWGLLPIVVFAHVAPEGLLGGAIYVTGYGTLALLLGAAVAKYLIPLFVSKALPN